MKLSVIALAFFFPFAALAGFGESVLLQTSSGVKRETGTLQNSAKKLSLPMSAMGIDIGTVDATVSYTMDATIK